MRPSTRRRSCGGETSPLGAGDEQGTHLLPVPLSEPLLQTYLPSQFTPADYPGVVPAGETVETVAIGAVLAAYSHAAPKRRERLVRFSKALSLKFEAFLQPPRHPKWRDVNLAASLPGWVRFGSQLPGLRTRRG